MRIYHPERKEYFKEYYQKNKLIIHSQRNKSRKIRRDYLIEVLGGKCCQCGFSDVRALQIDHINGGGRRELTEVRSNGKNYTDYLYKMSILEKDLFFSKYQLLCANCNWIKVYTNNESSNKK